MLIEFGHKGTAFFTKNLLIFNVFAAYFQNIYVISRAVVCPGIFKVP